MFESKFSSLSPRAGTKLQWSTFSRLIILHASTVPARYSSSKFQIFLSLMSAIILTYCETRYRIVPCTMIWASNLKIKPTCSSARCLMLKKTNTRKITSVKIGLWYCLVYQPMALWTAWRDHMRSGVFERVHTIFTRNQHETGSRQCLMVSPTVHVIHDVAYTSVQPTLSYIYRRSTRSK